MLNTDYWELLDEQHENDVILHMSQIDAEEKEMKVIDAYGDKVQSMPESAKCLCTGENPEYMNACPIDDFEGDCCPELCDHYTED